MSTKQGDLVSMSGANGSKVRGTVRSSERSATLRSEASKGRRTGRLWRREHCERERAFDGGAA